MAYSSRHGNRPFELASKSGHIHIIKDATVQAFLQKHDIPRESDDIELNADRFYTPDLEREDAVEFLIAVDGGDTTVAVRAKFPSSNLTFFQFGASLIRIEDLNHLRQLPFIDPAAMAKLKELQRIKFTLPTKNIGLLKPSGERATLRYSVRMAVYEFFKDQQYLDTLRWFLFAEYTRGEGRRDRWILASHPEDPDIKNIELRPSDLSHRFTFPHPAGDIALTDVFRLHETVDEELGAGGAVGYLRNLIEHFIIINTLRGLYERQREALRGVLFIKDGPLGFFGQTANLHAPMRQLLEHLAQQHDVYLVGVEKSGPFVEHAEEIKAKIPPGQAYLLDNRYIYTFVKPGSPDTSPAYGRSSYYGGKLIYRSTDERTYILTVPTLNSDTVLDPRPQDFLALDTILKYVDRLKSDMYDNSLIPIALANKLISLSDHPSSVLLEKFARRWVG